MDFGSEGKCHKRVRFEVGHNPHDAFIGDELEEVPFWLYDDLLLHFQLADVPFFSFRLRTIELVVFSLKLGEGLFRDVGLFDDCLDELHWVFHIVHDA